VVNETVDQAVDEIRRILKNQGIVK
jgi:hypothetical protein